MSKMKGTESEGQGDAAAAKLIDARGGGIEHGSRCAAHGQEGRCRLSALAAKAGAVVKILTDGQEVLYGIIAELRKVAL